MRSARILLIITLLSLSSQARGPEPGAPVPNFRLADQHGKEQDFNSLKGPNGLMLVFYRSADWCAFCKTQLVEMEQSREALRKRGLGVAAISYDSVPVLKHFADRKKIGFPLLSDTNSSVIREFGLLDEEAPKNSMFYGVPHPVTYILDANGVVKSRHFEEDFRRRYTTANILSEQLDVRSGAVISVVKNPRMTVRSSASNEVVRGGERIRLLLDLELPERMHIYAPGVQGYIPIQWDLDSTEAIEPMAVDYPPARTLHLEAIKETAPVYEKKTTIQREIVISQAAKLKPALAADSTFTLTGRLRFQACDDRKCYIPETIPLKWVFRYEPHDSQRVPVELQRKPQAR